MEKSNKVLYEGLHLMYLSTLITLVCAVGIIAVWIPVIGVLLGGVAMVAALVGGIMGVVGLVKLRGEHSDYWNAMIAMIVAMVCNLLGNGDGGFAQVMSTIGTIVSLFMTYFVIRATNQLVEGVGRSDICELGDKAWKMQLVSCIASVISAVLILVLPVLSIAIAVILIIISLAASIVYMNYLNQSSQAF